MRSSHFVTALACAALLAGFDAGAASAQAVTAVPSTGMPPTQTMAPMPQGILALDARRLLARRTALGYTLTGQALVKDGCQAARFDPSLLTIYPPQFNLIQFRRPGTMGMMCVMTLRWISAQPRSVTSSAPPRYVTVRTQKGITRVPIPGVPASTY